jgi:8-oxo-dGTP diphosphatase
MKKIINNVSVDCVIFGFHNKTLNVLLTKRELKDDLTNKIIFTDYTLQGHHVLEGENVNDAAVRIFKEKTGLDNVPLKQFYTFGNNNRLLSERDQLWLQVKYPTVTRHVVTIGYFALVDSSKVNPDTDHPDTKWFPFNKLPELAFDHKYITMSALDALRNEIRREPIAFDLLPEKFTLTQLQQLYETIFGVKLDKRNFRKKVAMMKYVIALDEKQTGVAHKPAQVFIFSRDVYEKTKKDKLDLSV